MNVDDIAINGYFESMNEQSDLKLEHVTYNLMPYAKAKKIMSQNKSRIKENQDTPIKQTMKIHYSSSKRK